MKYLKLIFVLTIVLPLLLIIVNGYLAGLEYEWNLINVNLINSVLSIVGLFGSISLLFLNHNLALNSKLWYTTAIIAGLVFAFLLLIVESNFGF